MQNIRSEERKIKNTRIYVAGHRRMVGSALTCAIRKRGLPEPITATHAELELTQQTETSRFIETNRPKITLRESIAATMSDYRAKSYK